MVEFLIGSAVAVVFLVALLWGPTSAPRSATRPRKTSNSSVVSTARDSYTHQEVFP
jgi:hypothetical protein